MTIEEILKGKQPELPKGLVKNYHKQAEEINVENDRQSRIGDFLNQNLLNKPQ